MRQRPRRRRREGRPTAEAVPVSGDRKRAGDAAGRTERLAGGAPTRCTGHGPAGMCATKTRPAHLTHACRLTHHRWLPSLHDRTRQAAIARDPAQGTWWRSRGRAKSVKAARGNRVRWSENDEAGRSPDARPNLTAFGTATRPQGIERRFVPGPPIAGSPIAAGVTKAGRRRSTRNAYHMHALNSGMRADLARIASDLKSRRRGAAATGMTPRRIDTQGAVNPSFVFR